MSNIIITKIGKNTKYTYLYLSDGNRIDLSNHVANKLLDALLVEENTNIKGQCVSTLKDKQKYITRLEVRTGPKHIYHIILKFNNTKNSSLKKFKDIYVDNTYDYIIEKLKEEV